MITWDAYPAVPAGTKLDLQTGRPVERPAELMAQVKKLAFDPSGRHLLSISEFIQDPIRLWQNNGTLVFEIAVDRNQLLNVHGLNAAFLPDGDRLIVVQNCYHSGPGRGTMDLWNANTGQLLESIGWRDHLSDIACLPNGLLLIVTSNGGVWRLSADCAGPPEQMPGWKRTVPRASRIALSSSGDRFAGVGRSRATVWSDDGTALASRVHAKSPQHGPASFRPYSTVLAVVHGTVVDLWDYGTGSEQTLIGHKRPVWAVGFSPDGRTAYTAASDGMMIAWDADISTIRQRYDFGTGKLYSAAVAPDGLTMALGGSDGRITVVDLEG